MALNAFDSIRNLEKSRTDWRIKVRVTRMWATVNPESGTTKGFNLILLDDDNEHIHAFSYADTWKAIGKEVIHGGVYAIENFIVRDASGNLKPVSNKNTIRFTNGTTFEKADDTSMIPLHKFEFIDLGDLYQIAILHEPTENPEYATDVIGVVENFETVKKIPTKHGDRDIVRFRLCDGSIRHRVAVWGDMAKSVNSDYSPDLEKPIVAILTSTKLTTYRESVQISTLPSSKVYFNLNDDCVADMKQRLAEEGYKPRENDDQQSYDLPLVSTYSKLTLSELSEIKPQKMKQKNMYCTFVISKVDEDCFWWYNSCNKCQSEVFKFQKIFKCDDCPRNIPVAEKRFRLKVVAQDATFSCNLFLMDRVVKPIVCISASNLKKCTDNDPKMIPDLLSGLAGREVTAIIEIMANGTSNSGHILYATDTFDPSIASESITEMMSPPEIPVVTLTDSIDHKEAGKTPGSAMSVNKKIKMEK